MGTLKAFTNFVGLSALVLALYSSPSLGSGVKKPADPLKEIADRIFSFRHVKSSSSDTSTARHLLQAQSKCLWANDKCEISASRLNKLASKSGNPRAIAYASTLECPNRETESSCARNSACLWDDFRGCISQIFVEQLDSCAQGDLQVFFDVQEASAICNGRTRDSCNARDICSWDEDTSACSPDTSAVVFGAGFDGNLTMLADAYEGFFSTAFNESRLEGPDAILDWDPPPFACPDDVDNLVCNYIDAVAADTKISRYCREKHSGEDERCESDPLCEMTFFECTAARTVFTSEAKEALPALLAAAGVGDPFIPFILCPSSAEEECVDTCLWDGSAGECGISWTSFAQTIVDILDEMDPRCALWRDLFGSGCIVDNASECAGNPNCEVRAEGECDVNADFAVRLMAADDKKLRRTARRANKNCSKRTTERACE